MNFKINIYRQAGTLEVQANTVQEAEMKALALFPGEETIIRVEEFKPAVTFLGGKLAYMED